nr:MAG TPA: holin [Caudoviricetes sp.]
MEQITQYITPELLILIPVLYFIGKGIKVTETIKDKYIPLILGASSVALAVVWVLATNPLSTWQDGLMAVFTALVQGVLCAGCSVYVDQIIKQSNKEE